MLLLFCLTSQVVAFFLKDSNREQSKRNEGGEVPDDFRKNSFQVCISGQTLAVANPLKETQLLAKLLLKRPGCDNFVEKHSTEVITGESSPDFTRRITFPAMTMENSQYEALNTTIRVDIYLHAAAISSIEFPLSELLWDYLVKRAVRTAIPRIPFAKIRKDTDGRVVVSVIRGQAPGGPINDHQVALSFSFGREAWSMIPEHRIYLTICSAGYCGRWNRIYASHSIKKSIASRLDTTFPRVYLLLPELTGNNINNPIRVELYACRPGYPRLLGFSHMTMRDLAKRSELQWNSGPSFVFSGSIVTRTSSVAHTRTDAHLHIDANMGMKKWLRKQTKSRVSVNMLHKSKEHSKITSSSVSSSTGPSNSRVELKPNAAAVGNGKEVIQNRSRFFGLLHPSMNKKKTRIDP